MRPRSLLLGKGWWICSKKQRIRSLLSLQRDSDGAVTFGSYKSYCIMTIIERVLVISRLIFGIVNYHVQISPVNEDPFYWTCTHFQYQDTGSSYRGTTVCMLATRCGPESWSMETQPRLLPLSYVFIANLYESKHGYVFYTQYSLVAGLPINRLSTPDE